jgi:hypothetical protein
MWVADLWALIALLVLSVTVVVFTLTYLAVLAVRIGPPRPRAAGSRRHWFEVLIDKVGGSADRWLERLHHNAKRRRGAA